VVLVLNIGLFLLLMIVRYPTPQPCYLAILPPSLLFLTTIYMQLDKERR